MKIEEFVAVSGLSGLYKMVANRSNGLIIENLDDGKRKLAPSRKHQFTPLASIGIYTDDDTEELRVVFRSMLEQLEANPPLTLSSSAIELNGYFAKILPTFDRDRVFTSDIKKVIKWFNFLNERSLLNMEDLQDPDPEEEGKEDVIVPTKANTNKAATNKGGANKMTANKTVAKRAMPKNSTTNK